MSQISRDALKDWKVLLVDDEPDSLEVAGWVLKYYGATLYTATNGLEALDVLRTITPTLIISDISMPEMDGWGLIAHIKNDRRTMDIPCIALTAHAMVGDRERAIASGFHNYLTKPLTPATFMHDLMNLLVNIPHLKAMWVKA
ncbi:MAG: response regulator [Chloroflexota bacterium]|nr:response regulator [Chloroflexota bacterium]